MLPKIPLSLRGSEKKPNAKWFCSQKCKNESSKSKKALKRNAAAGAGASVGAGAAGGPGGSCHDKRITRSMAHDAAHCLSSTASSSFAGSSALCAGNATVRK